MFFSKCPNLLPFIGQPALYLFLFALVRLDHPEPPGNHTRTFKNDFHLTQPLITIGEGLDDHLTYLVQKSTAAVTAQDAENEIEIVFISRSDENN